MLLTFINNSSGSGPLFDFSNYSCLSGNLYQFIRKMSMRSYQTPLRQTLLSDELRSLIHERNILTTKTRMKVLSALEDVSRDSSKVRQEERERQLRSNAIQEILTSEASYLQQLETVMKFFMEPLKSKSFVSQAEWTALFGNIDTLYKVNGALLEELKHSPENVAAAFLKLAPYFKLYSVYAYDYKQIVNILQEMHRKNARLAAFILSQETRPEVSRKLASLLIVPIQRIPRYRLLLREVLNHTKPFQQDFYTLQNALHEVEKTAVHVNSLVQEQENMEKMIKLQQSLQHGRPGIITPGRKFIKEGILMKVSSNGRRPLPRYFILFSDMLIYCVVRAGKTPSQPESLKCCCVLPLKRCIVEPVLSHGVLRLSCHGETFILYSVCVDDTKRWLEALQLALKQYHANLQTLRKDSSSRRPMRHKDLHKASCNQFLVARALKRHHSGFNDNISSPDILLKASPPAAEGLVETPDQRFHLLKNCLPDCRPNKIRRLLPQLHLLHPPQPMCSPSPSISHPLRSNLRTTVVSSSREKHVKIVTPCGTVTSAAVTECVSSGKKNTMQFSFTQPTAPTILAQDSGDQESSDPSAVTSPLQEAPSKLGLNSNDNKTVVSWSPLTGIQSVGEIVMGIHKALRRSLRRSLFRFTPELQLQ